MKKFRKSLDFLLSCIYNIIIKWKRGILDPLKCRKGKEMRALVKADEGKKVIVRDGGIWTLLTVGGYSPKRKNRTIIMHSDELDCTAALLATNRGKVIGNENLDILQFYCR